MNTPAPTTYPAALTRFDLPKDPHTRQYTPTLPQRLGIVHALNPLPEETRIHEPWFLEDPTDYRAALCGARVKVILPRNLALTDPDGCWECQRILRTNPPPLGRAQRWYSPTKRERNRRRAYIRNQQTIILTKNSEKN